MNSPFTRRSMISKSVLSAAATAALSGDAASAGDLEFLGSPVNDANLPKICLEMGNGGLAAGSVDEHGMRRVRQLGVNHVLMGGPRLPWQEDQLQHLVNQLKAGGIMLGNLMIGGFPKTIYGLPGRDEEIEKVNQSIRAAGKVGLPVIEYNFYAHRLVEGYYETQGRGGAGITSFDYDRVKELPALPDEGARTLDEMWANITYFLKAVIPVAEKANVRLALHPNDPPAPVSRGSKQIMGTLAGWKKLIEIVPSKSNGITFDCGVTREMGEDAVQVCRYFASRERINHVHYRNVLVEKPYEHYSETFPDAGLNNMFGVMRELVNNKYRFLLYPEHPRALDYDRERPEFKAYYPGGGGYAGFAYQVGYAKAMLQAVLASKS